MTKNCLKKISGIRKKFSGARKDYCTTSYSELLSEVLIIPIRAKQLNPYRAPGILVPEISWHQNPGPGTEKIAGRVKFCYKARPREVAMPHGQHILTYVCAKPGRHLRPISDLFVFCFYIECQNYFSD